MLTSCQLWDLSPLRPVRHLSETQPEVFKVGWAKGDAGPVTEAVSLSGSLPGPQGRLLPVASILAGDLCYPVGDEIQHQAAKGLFLRLQIETCAPMLQGLCTPRGVFRVRERFRVFFTHARVGSCARLSVLGRPSPITTKWGAQTTQAYALSVLEARGPHCP